MFERRLRIILWVICLSAMGLIGRAGQIQLVQHDAWVHQAADMLSHRQFIDTTRGRILDGRGRVLAMDEPCIDACVEYPAITADWTQNAKWLEDQAIASAERRFGQVFTQASREQRRKMITAESDAVRQRIADMWHRLAQVSGQSDAQIDQIRLEIVQNAEMQRHSVRCSASSTRRWRNRRRSRRRGMRGGCRGGVRIMG
jgi:cell division protein FtsI/penicillin-binding protein 2